MDSDSDEKPPPGARARPVIDAADMVVQKPDLPPVREASLASFGKGTAEREARRKANSEALMPPTIRRFFYSILICAAIYASLRYYNVNLADGVDDFTRGKYGLIKSWLAGER